MLSDNSLMLMTTTSSTPTTTLSGSDSRSISPLTPSPSREMRGIRLFRAISRKLGKRQSRRKDFEEEDDSRSSSTDSSCSAKKGEEHSYSSAESGFRSVSPHHLSSSSSDAGSDTNYPTKTRALSSSAESIRKVFQNLSINASGRSKSCTNTTSGKEQRKASKVRIQQQQQSVKTPPKRILRAPVSYTYVKGLSGLPTQRVPKAGHRIYMNNCGGCSMQYMTSMHR